MIWLDACRWLGSSWVGSTIRDSRWGFAIIEMAHLLGLALFGGALLVTGLRILGLFMTDRRPDVLTRDLQWPMLGGLAIMVSSGVLLFASAPLRYYANPAFRLKLLLILGASVAGIIVLRLAHRMAAKGNAPLRPSTLIKAMTLLSLTLWLAVGIAGRAIGVL